VSPAGAGPAALAAPTALAGLVQRQRPRLVAHLAHRLGLAHLAVAEDAVQHACLQALQHWPAQGTPDNPAGWLWRVALHQALDGLRRDQRLAPLPDDDRAPVDRAGTGANTLANTLGNTPVDTGADTPGPATVPAPTSRFAGELDDEELALLFAACHPALPPATQVALALRAAAGLDLATLADALLTTEAALAQRLARARRLLAGETLAVPAGPALAERHEAVLSSLLVMFGEGMKAAGRQGERQAGERQHLALCWEAIRLARAVAAHPASADPAADALAAQLLLHGARLSGRLDDQGQIVPLAGQPRDRWDAGMVRLGLAHLRTAQRAAHLSRYHVLAGIAAEHALAPCPDATPWPRIVAWYALLRRIDDSAAPWLGHAVALAEAGEPELALQQLDALATQVPDALRPHTLAAMARAHERAGRHAAAADCLRQAIARVRHAADAAFLERRLQTLASATGE